MTHAHDSAVLIVALATMMTLAVLRDMTRNRIDNDITFLGAALAVVFHGALAGWLGVGGALAGLAVGLVTMLPFHVAGGMAAGDVKLMAAAGAFLGPVDAFWAAVWSLVAGGVMGLAVLTAAGGIRDGVVATGRQFLTYALTRAWAPPPQGSAAARRFPYAAAIAAGSLALVAWRATRQTVIGA